MRDNRTGFERRPDGRRQGQGWWWENRVEEAIQKWDQSWRTATREHILGCEVDIIATGPVVDDTVIRLVVQCKDWRDKPVPPSEIYRLIALAIPCKAYPVIAHTGGLSTGARTIVDRWRLLELTPEIIETGEMPEHRSPPLRPRLPVPELFIEDERSYSGSRPYYLE